MQFTASQDAETALGRIIAAAATNAVDYKFYSFLRLPGREYALGSFTANMVKVQAAAPKFYTTDAVSPPTASARRQWNTVWLIIRCLRFAGN